MKRIVTAVLSTITILVLLFGYHTSTAGVLATGSATSVESAAPLSSSGSTETSGSGDDPSTDTAGGSDSSSSDSSDSSSSDSGSSTFTGTAAQTRWGPVQVEITVEAGKISAVSVVQYPNENPRDQEINASALPILVEETTQAQSADIDMVSGATYTSEGYLQSLQSALDQASL